MKMKKPEMKVLEESLKSCGTTLLPADTILLFRCSRVGLIGTLQRPHADIDSAAPGKDRDL